MAPEQGPDSKTQREKKETVANEEESAKNCVSSKDNNTTTSRNLNMDSVGWIHLIRKKQLIEQCRSAGIPTTGFTIEYLRQHLAEQLRSRRLSASTENMLLELENEIKKSEQSVVLEDETPLPRPPHHNVSDIEIMDIIHRWNLKFSGETDLLEFLERIEELAECHRISLTRLLPSMIGILTGKALWWYRIKRKAISSWEGFRSEMEKFFLPSRYLSNLEKAFFNRKQFSGERAKDYILYKLTLSRRHPILNKLDHLDRIYDGLRTEYRYYIRRSDFETLDDLINLTDEYEALKQEEIQPTAHIISDGVYRRMERCWRCKGLGHKRTKCVLPARLFCSYCGKEGLLSRKCPCRENPGINTNPSAHHSRHCLLRKDDRFLKRSSSETSHTPLHMLKSWSLPNEENSKKLLNNVHEQSLKHSENPVRHTMRRQDAEYPKINNYRLSPRLIPLAKREPNYTRNIDTVKTKHSRINNNEHNNICLYKIPLNNHASAQETYRTHKKKKK